MTKITVYDDTAKKLEKVAEKKNTSIAEIIDDIIEFADDFFEKEFHSLEGT